MRKGSTGSDGRSTAGSGGTFTSLAVPGDIVAALPAMLSGIRDFAYSIGLTNGDVVPLMDGTFSVTVPLTPGANHVELTMAATAG